MKECFSQHKTIFTHGRSSPDLNSIENLWDVLEKSLCSGPNPPTSLQDFGENLIKLCMKINVTTLHKLGNNAKVNPVELDAKVV